MKNYVFIDLNDTQLIKMRDACAGIEIVLCEITPFDKDDIGQGTKVVLVRDEELLFLIQVWKVDRRLASEVMIGGYNITENLQGTRKIEEFWNEISSDPTLTEDFIEAYKTKLNWYQLCVHREMDRDFLEKYAGLLNWPAICWHQKLSEEFVEKHADKVVWYALHTKQNFSQEFIDKHRWHMDQVR